MASATSAAATPSRILRNICPAGLDFIKGFESFVPYVYDDLRPPVRINGRLQYREWKPGDDVRGTLTIGYGHTDDARYDLGFKLRNVPRGFRLTEAQASEILDVDLDECEEAVQRLVKVPIDAGQYAGIVSLTFNFGIGNLTKSTLLSRLNRRDYKGARAAFDLYVYSKGKRLRGLQRRRDGEQDLWDRGDAIAPVEVVHHPAEIDMDNQPLEYAPGMTVSDIRPQSRKLQTINAGKLTSGATAAGVVATMFVNIVDKAKGVSDAIRTVEGDGILLGMGAAAFVLLVVFAVLEGWTWDDFVHGRWLPSGRNSGGSDSDAVAVDDPNEPDLVLAA